MMGQVPSETGASTTGRNSTADRAIDVLFLFDVHTPVLSAGDIAERLGMSRSTTYRYLQSLRTSNLLEEDAVRGGFRLGSRVFELARIAVRASACRRSRCPSCATWPVRSTRPCC